MRFVLVTYLTFLAFELATPVKISNFEAHADMNIIHLRILTAYPTSLETPLKKGNAYKHTPRTSTIASSSTGDPSVRSLERSDEASE